MISIYLIITAAEELSSWWETTSGRRVAFFLTLAAAIAVIAGAVKAVRYLVDQGVTGFRWGKVRIHEKQRRNDLLDEMLAPEGWPALVTSVNEMQGQLGDVHTLVNSKMTAALARIDELEALLRHTDVPVPPDDKE